MKGHVRDQGRETVGTVSQKSSLKGPTLEAGAIRALVFARLKVPNLHEDCNTRGRYLLPLPSAAGPGEEAPLSNLQWNPGHTKFCLLHCTTVLQGVSHWGKLDRQFMGFLSFISGNCM